jgi:AAA domain
MPFVLAKKGSQPLRMALAGTGGAGKTLTSLLIGHKLAAGGSIALIDTEAGSASLYAGKVPGGFHVLELSPAGPVQMVEAMKEAEATKAKVLIIDSASAEWAGPGGCLEMVDNAKFKGWAMVTPLHNRFYDAIRAWPGHVIITVRRKIEYAVSPSGAPKKIGLTMVQRDGLEYELDLIINLEDSLAVVSKSRLDPPLAQGVTVNRDELPILVAKVAHAAADGV